ncbi:uncharacterized protein RCC_01531 [Ramularia collo-cygni]|uniref:Uncharacterized protein n=1 Tax=Ramularia collo-cygni TaxID=112498 RepID=A0A2D3UUL8_9PEZI|nr:uncharacterized protein RCC_01531 [Ramularia collo-cygni]CZT15697.1 uncharacterized protein RCC_01531 [Ramularia collo-cygni]
MRRAVEERSFDVLMDRQRRAERAESRLAVRKAALVMAKKLDKMKREMERMRLGAGAATGANGAAGSAPAAQTVPAPGAAQAPAPAPVLAAAPAAAPIAGPSAQPAATAADPPPPPPPSVRGPTLVLFGNRTWREIFPLSRNPSDPFRTCNRFTRAMNAQVLGEVLTPTDGYLHRALQFYRIPVAPPIRLGPTVMREDATMK